MASKHTLPVSPEASSKKAKTDKSETPQESILVRSSSPFEFDESLASITPEIIEAAIPALPKGVQQGDLNLINVFSRSDRSAWESTYLSWRELRNLSLVEQHEIRDVQARATQSRSNHSDLITAIRASRTFHKMHTIALGLNLSELANAAAVKLFDYLIVCHMNCLRGKLKVEDVGTHFPEFRAWLQLAPTYIRQHRDALSRSLVQGSTTTGIDTAQYNAPSATNTTTATENLTRSLDPESLGKQAVATVGGDVLELASIVKSCIVDTSKTMDMDQIRVCPALKLKLAEYLDPVVEASEMANGILLFGRPGTGKTTLVHAMASEFDYTLFDMAPAKYLSKWQGDSEKFTSAIFEEAVSHQPSMIFIDEIELLTYSRNEADQASSKAIISTLLSQWSKLQREAARVVVVGATIHPSRIDNAFLRRLELRLYVRGPREVQRKEIFLDALSKRRHEIPVEYESSQNYNCLETLLKDNSARLKRFTGSDIVGCVKTAEKVATGELLTCKAFTRISSEGVEALRPATQAELCLPETIHKSLRELSKADRKIVVQRPMNYYDLQLAVEQKRSVFNDPHKAELKSFNVEYGANLETERLQVGLPQDYDVLEDSY
ncbi:MAG: hypothetical protein Q9195_002510 [Heterodermia aff. obscurata]